MGKFKSGYFQNQDGSWYNQNSRGNKRRAEIRFCQTCGKEFPFASFGRAAKGLYCSVKCANQAYKPGRHWELGTHPNWKGGRSMSHGYVLVKVRKSTRAGDGGYKLEHRFVMEKILGRPLLQTEQVHHKNGIKTDNRPENLELRSGPHGRGATDKHCPTCTCFEHYGENN